MEDDYESQLVISIYVIFAIACCRLQHIGDMDFQQSLGHRRLKDSA